MLIRDLVSYNFQRPTTFVFASSLPMVSVKIELGGTRLKFRDHMRDLATTHIYRFDARPLALCGSSACLRLFAPHPFVLPAHIMPALRPGLMIPINHGMIASDSISNKQRRNLRPWQQFAETFHFL